MFEVLKKNYNAPPFCLSEAMRYASCSRSEELKPLFHSMFKKAEDALSYRVCYAEVPVKIDINTVDLGFTSFNSRDLAKNLSDCKSAIIFAATLGIRFDRLCSAHSRTSPSAAVILQGIGAERIEALCDLFTEDALKSKAVRPRFSPGYGDFSIEYQKDIFSLLDPSKNIGLTLTDNFLMSPTKSVSAIIGIL